MKPFCQGLLIYIAVTLLITPVTAENLRIKNVGGIEFVYIEGGEFMMGATDDEMASLKEKLGSSIQNTPFLFERPRHKVKIDSFWISRYELTQEQFYYATGDYPSFWTGDGRDPRYMPLDKSSWQDVVRFCRNFREQNNLSALRAPTEAEWEYAARAGTTTRYYWGDEMNGEYCWNSQNGNQRPHPVGMKKPNAWGLYDMTGNIKEWCRDFYHPAWYRQKVYNNPQGPSYQTEFKVVRGGRTADSDEYLRVAARSGSTWQERVYEHGIRLVIPANSNIHLFPDRKMESRVIPVINSGGLQLLSVYREDRKPPTYSRIKRDRYPAGLAVDEKGNAWGATLYDLYKLEKNETATRTGPRRRPVKGFYYKPYKIRLAPNGNVYFTDWHRQVVIVLKQDGTWVNEIPIPSKRDMKSDFGINIDNNIVMIENDANRIVILDQAGKVITHVPLPRGISKVKDRTTGNMEWQIRLASHNGKIYFLAYAPAEGKPLVIRYSSTLQEESRTVLQLDRDRVNSIHVDIHGNIYITDATHRDVRKFSPQGKELWVLKHFSARENDVLHAPVDVATWDGSIIYISDYETLKFYRIKDPTVR